VPYDTCAPPATLLKIGWSYANGFLVERKTSFLPPTLYRIKVQTYKLLGGNGCGQLLTALGTTSFQNIAAAIGAHPFTKTVGTLTTNPAWLIGPFHDSVQLLLLLKAMRVIFCKEAVLNTITQQCQE
jgi:hypothetical protein